MASYTGAPERPTAKKNDLPALHEDATPEERPTKHIGRGPNRDMLVSLSLFAVALSAYLAVPTAHFSYDAVASGILLYQWMASHAVGPLFHRYHVLYLPMAAGAEMVLKRFGSELDPLSLLQLLNAPFSAGSVALYYRLARAMGHHLRQQPADFRHQPERRRLGDGTEGPQRPPARLEARSERPR
jgi:hypothetical protein